MTESTDLARSTERAISTHMLGQYMEAERLYRRALTAIADETNPTYQDLLTLNVRLLFSMGEFDNALKVGNQLLKLREKHFGFHHPQTGSVLRLLSEIKAAQNNKGGAVLDIRRALDIWMDTLGWQAKEPDPHDFELHQMAGPRTLFPEFDWIFAQLDQNPALARLTPAQRDARRFTLLIEIGYSFSWLGLHKTASRLFQSATALVERVPPQMIWQSYWAGSQAAQSFNATQEAENARAFLNAFLRVLANSFENGTDVSPVLLVNLAEVEDGAQNFPQALANLTRALNLLMEIHGDTHIQIAPLHVKLGDLYHKMGDLRAGENHYEKAISILESWHGTNDISLVQPLFRKGLLHKTARQYPQAEKAFARSLEVLLPRDQGDVDLGARIFEELALVYMKQYSFQQAQMAQMRGLDMLREHGRPTDILLARCEANMASIYMSIAKYVDAERNAESALKAFEKQPDKAKYKSETAALYTVHGKIEVELGRLQPASQSFRQAEAVLDTMPHPDIELAKDLHLACATLYMHQGSPSKAATRLNEILDLDQGVNMPVMSEKSLEAMLMLARIDLMTGKLSTVEDSLLKVVKVVEEKSGSNSADALAALAALGSFYVNQKKLTAAEAALDRCTNIVEYSPDLRKQPVYGGYLSVYADLLTAKGAFEIATERLKKALAVYEGCFSSLHPKCADVWINISATLLARGVEDQADEAAHKAVTICSNAFEWNHHATMKALAYEAYVSMKRERYDVALALAERLMPAMQTVRVPADFRTLQALSLLYKNEMLNNRTRNMDAIQEYLERNLNWMVFSYNISALEVLADLMTFVFKREPRQLAVTIGNTIIDYLARPDCLIEGRKAKLQTMLMRCHDYAYTPESKALIERINKALEQS